MNGLLSRLTACAVLLVASAPAFAQKVDPRVNSGRRAMQDGDRDQALQLFGAVLCDQPDDAQSLLSITLYLCQELTEYQAAEPFARRVVVLLPELPASHLAVGRCLIFQRRTREAEEHFAEAVKRFPEDPRVLFGMGMASVLNRKHLQAAEYYKKAIALDSSEALYHFCAGENFIKIGRQKVAERSFRRCLAIDPNHAQAAGLLAQLLGWQGRNDEAEVLFRDAIRKAETPEDRVDAAYYYAVFLIDQRREPQAVEVLLEIVDRRPNHRMAWAQLATCYQRLGNKGKRAQARKKYLALQSQHDRTEDSILLDQFRRLQSESRENRGPADGKGKTGSVPPTGDKTGPDKQVGSSDNDDRSGGGSSNAS